MAALLIAFFGCILYLSEGKRMNVDVTLRREDAFSLFTESEIMQIKFPNTTMDIIEVNVVIDESRLNEIRQLKNVMAFDIIHDDADLVYKAERERLANRTRWTASQRPEVFFLQYRNWDEYLVFIDQLVARIDIAELDILGTTVQGRDIPLVRLSTGGGDKPGFYIQAALHAREWLANSATTYILNAFAEGYDNDARITNILNKINIYVVPTVNVDGYIYSWTSNRNWRKNRRNNGGTFGVDLNRNYDRPTGSWCTTGTSTNPSSDTYCGSEPLSEPETQASADFITDPANNIRASFDMHTRGNLLLRPYAYAQSQPPLHQDGFFCIRLGNA
eukprot:38301_1